MLLDKCNAVTEIMLYECHSICKYTTKRSQMPSRMTIFPVQRRVGTCSVLIRLLIAMLQGVSLLFQCLRQSTGEGVHDMP